MAVKTGFTAIQETNLPASDIVNLKDILARPQFSASLDIDPDVLTPGTQYELSVEFTLELTMEGI